MRLRPAALAGALACLLPALVACGGGATSKVGDVLPARHDKQFVHAKRSKIATPIGTLVINAARPVTQIPADDTADLQAQTAPAGSSYLPMTWRYDESTVHAYANYLETPTLPTVDLRLGDGSYRLPVPDPAQGAQSFYVLVADGSGHPSLKVGFDGVDQTVDLTTGKRDVGRAAGLYRLSHKRLQGEKCTGKPTFAGVVALAAQDCTLTGPVLLPYAGGKWAPAGHDWLVLSVQTALSTITQAGSLPGSGGVYYATGVRSSYRFNGRAPAEVIEANNDSASCPAQSSGVCNTNAALVFATKRHSGTLTVVQQLEVLLSRGYGAFDGKKQEKLKQTLAIDVSAPR